MTEGIYLDNDIVLKMCTYSAGQQLIHITSTTKSSPAILKVAQFALRSRVDRSKVIQNKDDVKALLEKVLRQVRKLEPTLAEVEYAAELEQKAAMIGLAFDTGESQLISMLLNREALALATGDKRALRALAKIAPNGVKYRLVCLEQAVATLITSFGVEPFRSAVCTARASDIALKACFQCSSQTLCVDDILDGLRSYTRALRSETGELLITSEDLSAIIPQEDSVRSA